MDSRGGRRDVCLLRTSPPASPRRLSLASGTVRRAFPDAANDISTKRLYDTYGPSSDLPPVFRVVRRYRSEMQKERRSRRPSGETSRSRVRACCLYLLRAVDLDDVLLGDLLIDEKLRDEFTLVALELHNLAELGVLDDRAVAVELLLALLQDDLLVDLGVDPLHGREGLAAVPLLGADVNVPALRGVGLLRLLRGRSVVVGEIEIGS